MGDTAVPISDGGLKAGRTVEIERLYIEDQIAEKKHRSAVLKADGERIITGQLKKLEADIKVLDREVRVLEARKETLDQFGAQKVIELNSKTGEIKEV